jgi:hypothetical protein
MSEMQRQRLRSVPETLPPRKKSTGSDRIVPCEMTHASTPAFYQSLYQSASLHANPTTHNSARVKPCQRTPYTVSLSTSTPVPVPVPTCPNPQDSMSCYTTPCHIMPVPCHVTPCHALHTHTRLMMQKIGVHTSLPPCLDRSIVSCRLRGHGAAQAALTVHCYRRPANPNRCLLETVQ